MTLPFLGIQVIESKNAPKDKILYMVREQQIVVFDMWRQISWPLFLDEQRKLIRSDLARIVKAVEQRLFGGIA